MKGIELCKKAMIIGGTMPAVLCIANDVAVEKFLNGECSFLDIYKFIEYVMSKHIPDLDYDLEKILELKKWVKNFS